jgi:arylsulfatase A-like enzyme
MDDLVVIISSDHGENMGELGIYGDHITADNITHRIPMIIRWPGSIPDNVVDTSVDALQYNLDLAPTLADMLGAPPPDVWDGSSYAPSLRGVNLERPRPELILSQCAGTCQRSVRFDNWIYIHTYHDGYNFIPKEMLFDVEKDPFEQNDVADQHPEVCKDAVYRLSRWHEEMMHTMPEGYTVDPMWTVISEGGPSHVRGRLPRFIEELEKEGRTKEAEAMRERHPRGY